MEKEFLEKVLSQRIVDTDTYRYTVKEHPDHMDIIRLPLEALDTTSAIDGWEVVWTIR